MGRPSKLETLRWKFSPKQVIAMYWWSNPSFANCSGIIADGSVRSGKTVAMAFGFMMWSMECYSNETFALCGKTIQSFRRNVLEPMKTIAPYLGYGLYENKSDHLVVLRSAKGVVNKYYIFGGNDEKSQDLIQGITLAGLLLDEVVLMPESFVNQALARLSVTGAKVWMNANPEGPSHFVKVRFIDEYRKRNLLHMHFVMDDNLSLSEERLAFYKSQWTGMFYRRYILGEWCLADGLVYSMFDEHQHVFKSAIDFRDYDLLIVSCDYGTQNPTAFLMMGYNMKRKRVEVIKEYYYNGREEQVQKTDAELYDDLVSFIGGLTVVGIYCDPSAQSFITQIKKKRQYRVKQADNDVNPGIAYTAQLLGLGQLAVHASCKSTRKEFSSYAWDTEKSQEQGKDIVLKDNDHAMDAMRYGLYTFFRSRAKNYRLGYYSNLA